MIIKSRLSEIQIDERIRWWGFAGLLAVLAVLTYGSLVQLGFDSHDRESLIDSAAISEDFFYLFSTAKAHTSGRPLYELVVWLEYIVWGGDMRYFHLAGVAWHWAAALLLARLCRRLGFSWALSATSGVLFFYNVSHYRAIHWMSAQCYIVSLVILCAGLWSYLSWREDGRLRGQVGFYAALLGGLFVHSAAILLLPLAALLAWSRRQRLVEIARGLILPGIVGGLGVLAIKVYYANAPQAGQLSGYFDPWAHAKSYFYLVSRLVTTAHALPFALFERAAWEWVVGAVVCGAGLFGAYRWSRDLGFWALWVLLAPLPFLVLDPAHLAALMPGPSRYLYTASAGIAVLGAAAFCRLAAVPRIGVAAYGLLVPLLVVSHIELKRAEEASRYIAGRTQFAHSDWAMAAEQLTRAVAQGGGTVPSEDAYMRIFISRLALGEPVADELQAARARLPDSRVLALLTDVMAVADADPSARAAAVERVEEQIGEQRRVGSKLGNFDLATLATVYFRHWGLGLAKRGEYARAVVPLHYALQRDPRHGETLASWAVANVALEHFAVAARACGEIGDWTWAAKLWRAAVEKTPGDEAIRLEWLRSLVLSGALAEAAERYRNRYRAGTDAEAVFELGLRFLLRGDGAAAQGIFASAVRVYGAEAAERLGVVGRLRDMSTGDQYPAAVEILQTHWPEG